MTKPKVKPALGFSAAKLFRKESQKDFVKFLHRHLFFLASTMQLIGTGGTVKFIKQLLKRRSAPRESSLVQITSLKRKRLPTTRGGSTS